MTIVAAEQQTMNFYMNHGADFIEPIARGLYAEIAMIEELHLDMELGQLQIAGPASLPDRQRLDAVELWFDYGCLAQFDRRAFADDPADMTAPSVVAVTAFDGRAGTNSCR